MHPRKNPGCPHPNLGFWFVRTKTGCTGLEGSEAFLARCRSAPQGGSFTSHNQAATMGLPLRASLLAGIVCAHAAMVSGVSGGAPHSHNVFPLASTTTCLWHHPPLLLATSTLRMSGGGGQQQQQRGVAGPAVLGKILDDAQEESSDDRSNGWGHRQ